MKALTRKEALINAKANGALDEFKPLTRDEVFAKKALGLGGSGGGSAEYDIVFVLPEVPYLSQVTAETITVECANMEKLYEKIENGDLIKAIFKRAFTYGEDFFVDWTTVDRIQSMSSGDGKHSLNVSGYFTDGDVASRGALTWSPQNESSYENGIFIWELLS